MNAVARSSLALAEVARQDGPRLFEQAADEPIDSSRLHYYARYFGDPQARLFWRERRLWLGVLAPHAEFVTNLLHSHVLDDLFAQRLLFGLDRRPSSVPGFDAVYELDSTPRITYWHEWSPKMWRAASLRLIELFVRLAEHDLTLRNPHPWTLLFDGRQFSYANPASIVRLDSQTFARSYEKLASFFIRPLLLVEHGCEHTARRLCEDLREGVSQRDIEHLESAWTEWNPDGAESSVIPFLEQAAAEIESLALSAPANRWIDYFATDCDLGIGTSWARKQEVLTSILEREKISSVLDLGANTGHYARQAAQQGREVIAADFDPALVDVAYTNTQESDLSLYPVVLDFTLPTPGRGVNHRWFPPATERLKSDLVLCFALAHHMVFGKYRLDFEEIASGVKSFSSGRALVEYVGRERVQPAEWRPDADSWYSPEEFASALGRHFPHVDILTPAKDGRRLLVCGPRGGAV
ncbi:class I SAM-dependent methyltransferase [Granulicella sp. L60]|uniref:class I SAM-dependent methyltransferase n=1 Tax=Granulicella sp. L60 TaxID=1641866 RepID=UPI00131B1474|nr:class I SAM-dependent methyltransferase [Granulicella sp. L60]